MPPIGNSTGLELHVLVIQSNIALGLIDNICMKGADGHDEPKS